MEIAKGWTRGAYQCLCKPGYYSARHPNGFNGTIMEVAYQEYRDNISKYYDEVFRCTACAIGCVQCTSSAPCLASYNWVVRLSLLTISVLCACFTLTLACYMYRHRKVKVFKVASPIFLTITLLGCAIMYLEVCFAFTCFIILKMIFKRGKPFIFFFLDGCYISNFRCLFMCCHQMDTTYGLLYNVHSIVDENVEVN